MNTKNCKCASCDKIFAKTLGEYNRKIKYNTPFYCSRNCSARESIKRSKNIIQWINSEENKNQIKQKCNNKKDQYSPFRKLLRRTKYRNKNNDLDLQYIKQLWESQNGTCAILGHPLTLPSHVFTNHNYLASIDRLDNSKGYTKDNVRIVCASINYVRNKFNDDHLFEFIQMCANKK
jgi:hypothetical protein